MMTIRNEKDKAVDLQILRFERSARRRLRTLAGLSPRLGDLILSFPGAAFAIATDSVEPTRTGEAVRRVKAGCGLRDVAEPLGLPMWLKRVPPEAFNDRIANLPDGEKFARQMPDRIPHNPLHAPIWLNWVRFAGTAAGDDFALWVAGQPMPFGRVLAADRVPLRPLAMFAWYSLEAPGAARDLIEKPWQPTMRYSKAVGAMQLWLDRVAQLFKPTRPHRGPGRYRRRREGNELRIVALRTPSSLRDEGNVMNHCAGGYTHLVASGVAQLFSVRAGDKRLATFELRSGWGRSGYSLVQLQGPGNSRVCETVTRFVRTWVDGYAADPARAMVAIGEEYELDARSFLLEK